MPGALERALGVARVERRLEPDVLDHRVRDAEVGQERAPDVLERRQLHGVGQHALRQHVGHPLVDPDDHLRRVAGLGEGVDDVAGPPHLRVDEVEGAAVEVGLVGDVVHRRGDVVDGHDVRLADLDADQREPLGQRVADLLDRLEEVVRAVDLVHLAGLGVADDDRRPVHAPRHRGPLAHELLGLELGAVVRVGELLALVEDVLGEVAVVHAGDGDRGGVVEVARAELVGEVDGVLGAVDVEPAVALLVGGHVVDRREVEEVLDARERRPVLVGDAEQRLGEVADDRLDAVARRGPQPARRASSFSRDSSRTSTWMSPSRSSRRSTRCRPMKPVAPVTK